MSEVRPYSVAWYQMQVLQSKTFGANPTESGFPDAVASTGLKEYDQSLYWPANVLTFRGGALFMSNTAIPAPLRF